MSPCRRVLLAASLASFLPLVACVGAAPGTGSTGPSPTDSRSKSSNQATKQPSAVACATSLDAYCSREACYTSWSSADEACMNAVPGSFQFSTACGSSSYALDEGDRRSYYDATSNALVAVFDENGGCLGGPADFVAPQTASCPLIGCGTQSCGNDGGMAL